MCRVVSCRVVSCCVVLCRVVSCCVVSCCCVVLCCVVLCCVVLCCVVLCCVVLCCVVLCCVVSGGAVRRVASRVVESGRAVVRHARVQDAVALDADHISMYDLQLEEGTAFWKWYGPEAVPAAAQQLPLPEEDESVGMWESASAVLTAEGNDYRQPHAPPVFVGMGTCA